MRDIQRLFDEFAAAPDTITRQIGAYVEILAQTRQARVARLGDCEHRTGFRICLSEPQEVVGERLRQNDEVGLDVTRRQSRRGPREVPRPDPRSLAPTGFDSPR